MVQFQHHNFHINLPSSFSQLHLHLHLPNCIKPQKMDHQNKHVAVFAFPFGSHLMPLLNLVLKLAHSLPNCSFSFIGTDKSNAILFPKYTPTLFLKFAPPLLHNLALSLFSSHQLVSHFVHQPSFTFLRLVLRF